MYTNLPFSWRCPSCHEKLTIMNNHWRCTNRHSFDIAKEAYVNLLLAQYKNSKDPGDNKDMVTARRAFLAQDHYLPLANTIADILHQHISQVEPNASSLSFFDAGCGEGYYLEQIAQNILNRNSNDIKPKIYASGIDISKPAIQKAAKKCKSNSFSQFHFAVASCFDLPILDKSQNAIIQIFAPAKTDEILRVLQDQGIWIKVSPASDHLYELKSMVYDKPAKHELDNNLPLEFSLASQQELRFEISLTSSTDRQNLLMMTPFYWTISEAKKQKLLADLQTTQAHFKIQIFQKS
jgi:23S rRNA (guanine745-N1)-methyltransferase